MNTTYFLNQIMGNVFHTDEDPVIPAAYYIGLSSTEPNVSGGNVSEPRKSGTAYARVLLDKLSAPRDGIIKNTSPISFTKSSASWGTMTHYVVYDAATGGNLLFYGRISGGITVDANAVITIPADGLTLTLSDLT